ncbi:MAG: hypothetical protein HKN09_01360 [Saprospiraceae bacterium]|nr:hypothetical protein [Saprospiraceae bacterium]
MKKNLCLILIGISGLISCQSNNAKFSVEKPTADQLYADARKMAKEIKYDSALVLLKLSFEKEFDYPMKIVSDSNFYDLIDDPIYRPEIRFLLEQFSTTNQATMVRNEEIGEPIYIKGVIVDETTADILEGVKIELVHADNDGFYFIDEGNWNPRLFSYLTSNSKGEFSINTIRPGRYKDDDGNYVPAHVHFTLNREGYRSFGSEFTFEDDSIFKANGNLENVPVARLLNTDSKNQYFVKIAMQKE